MSDNDRTEDEIDGELIARQIPRFEVQSVVCVGREPQV